MQVLTRRGTEDGKGVVWVETEVLLLRVVGALLELLGLLALLVQKYQY